MSLSCKKGGQDTTNRKRPCSQQANANAPQPQTKKKKFQQATLVQTTDKSNSLSYQEMRRVPTRINACIATTTSQVRLVSAGPSIMWGGGSQPGGVSQPGG